MMKDTSVPLNYYTVFRHIQDNIPKGLFCFKYCTSDEIRIKYLCLFLNISIFIIFNFVRKAYLKLIFLIIQTIL